MKTIKEVLLKFAAYYGSKLDEERKKREVKAALKPASATTKKD